MIKVQKEKAPKRKIKPYYILEYNYMIGDANGNTSEVVKVSKDNPYVEKYCKLLNKLEPNKNSWGVMLNSEDLDSFLDEKQITQANYEFLNKCMFEPEDFYDNEKEYEFYSEFWDGVRSDTEYSFLVFQGVELTYVDADKKKHKTNIKPK